MAAPLGSAWQPGPRAGRPRLEPGEADRPRPVGIRRARSAQPSWHSGRSSPPARHQGGGRGSGGPRQARRPQPRRMAPPNRACVSGGLSPRGPAPAAGRCLWEDCGDRCRASPALRADDGAGMMALPRHAGACCAASPGRCQEPGSHSCEPGRAQRRARHGRSRAADPRRPCAPGAGWMREGAASRRVPTGPRRGKGPGFPRKHPSSTQKRWLVAPARRWRRSA